MSKINDFFESHAGALNGYNKLAKVMIETNKLNSVLETGIELKEFSDCVFTVRCFDGVALAVSDKVNVVLEYPTKKELTHEQLQKCLEYRGLFGKINEFQTITANNTTFGDIMLLMGKLIMIHHKQ